MGKGFLRTKGSPEIVTDEDPNASYVAVLEVLKIFIFICIHFITSQMPNSDPGDVGKYLHTLLNAHEHAVNTWHQPHLHRT